VDVIFARALGRAWPHLRFDAEHPVWVLTGGDPHTAMRAVPATGMQPLVFTFDGLVRRLHRRFGAKVRLLTAVEEMAIAASVCRDLGLSARLGPDAPAILLELAPADEERSIEPELAAAAGLLRTRLLGVSGGIPMAAALDPLRRALAVPTAAFRAWAATVGGLVLLGGAALPAPARALVFSFAEALGRCNVPSAIPLRCGRLRGGDDPLALLIEAEDDPSIAPFDSERSLRRALVSRALQGDGAVRLRVALSADSVFDLDDVTRLVERADPIDAWSEGLAEGIAPPGVRAVRCPDGSSELDFVAEEVARSAAEGATIAIGVVDVELRADAIAWALARVGIVARFPGGRPLSRWPLVRRFSAECDPALLDLCDPEEWEVAEEVRRLIADVDAAETALAPTATQASLFGPTEDRPIDRRGTLIALLRSARLQPRSSASNQEVDVVPLSELVDHPARHRFALGLTASDVPPDAAALGTLAALVRDGWYGGGEVCLTWPESLDGRRTSPVPWLTHWLAAAPPHSVAFLAPEPAAGPPEPVEVAGAPPRLRITAVETYARCPIRWWFQHRLHLEEVREPTPEVRADARGTAAHGILERFVRELGSRSLDSPAARGLLSRLANEAFAGVAAETPAQKAFLSEEQARWTDGLLDERPAGLLAAWLDRERELLSGIVPVAVELPVSLFVDGTELVGRIDRVDRVRDAGLLITDYKTGAAPTISELRRGLALQMVAYRLALEHGDALSGLDEPVDRSRIAASFLELRRPGEVERRGWIGDPELLAALAPSRRGSLPLPPAASAALHEHLRGVVRRMRAGIVHPTLADPEEVGCAGCPYRAICRYDPSAADDWAGRDDVQAPLAAVAP
jgi:RecB family exonuclease